MILMENRFWLTVKKNGDKRYKTFFKINYDLKYSEERDLNRVNLRMRI